MDYIFIADSVDVIGVARILSGGALFSTSWRTF